MSIAHSKRGGGEGKKGKKGTGVWRQSTHTPRARERGLLPTRSLGDRAGTNIYLEAAERHGNSPAEAGSLGGGTDGNEEDCCPGWIRVQTGRCP